MLDVLNKAIQKRTRNFSEIGLLLSGGLDSGAVASLTCRQLERFQKKLYTFTSTPFSKYDDWLSKPHIADESIFVKEYRHLYQNIEMCFLPCEGKNSYTTIDENIKILEQPYKFVENSFWILESVKKARNKKIDLLLTAQLGNATISWGFILPYLLCLDKHFQFTQILHEMKNYSDKKNTKISSIYKQYLISKMPFWGKYLLSKIFRDKSTYSDFLPLNNDFRVFYENGKDGKDIINSRFITREDSLSERLKIFGPSEFSQRAVYSAKLGMKFNIYLSDPTDDVEVIEFCLNLPENQFVRDGVERRLIKKAMKGYMPDKVLNTKMRGRQSADWIQRIKPYWPVIKEELLSIGDFQLEKKYLDRTIIQKNLDMLEGFDFIRGDNLHMRILFRTLVFSRFLRMIEKGTLFDD